ncbi:uncharacterized protein [Henckelia pumila]|uniref:uncharacterized protein n=1 Tax=Henckelia pumila TaxID=405737 RepID=UPI003C6E0F2F
MVVVGGDLTYEDLVRCCHQEEDNIRRNRAMSYSSSKPTSSLGPKDQSFKKQGDTSSSSSGSGGVHRFSGQKWNRCQQCRRRHHAGFSNPIADALSRKVYVSLLRTSSIARVVEECCSLGFTFRHKKENQGVCVSSVLAEPMLYTRICESQTVDPKTQKLARLAQDGNNSGFHLQNDGLLCLSGRVVVPDDSTLREEILTQAHRSRFSVHPGSMKMSRNCDAIWVVVDRLLKSAHFLPYNRNFTFDRMAYLYVQEVVSLYGIPLSIVSDRDQRFTSRFWGSFQRALGTTLILSTSYHPKTDGQSGRTIRTLEDMLRSIVTDFGPAWHDHLALVEFAYNNIYHNSIDMEPFEALYGRRCRTPLFWDEVGEHQVEGQQMIQQMTDAVDLIRKRIKAAQDR